MLVIAGMLSANCFAYSKGFTNTPLRGQQTDYWCWAASCQMLLETQNRNFTQAQVAGNINRGATPLEARVRLTACAPDIQWDLINNYLDFGQVINTINAGWAIYTHLQSSAGAHAMVITGYDHNAAYNNVWMQDPWGNSTAPHTGVEGWCNYAAPVHGNYGGTPFAQWQYYCWTTTIC